MDYYGVEHSPKYEKCKNYWDQGLWGEDKMRQAVVREWITPEEFTEITGIDY